MKNILMILMLLPIMASTQECSCNYMEYALWELPAKSYNPAPNSLFLTDMNGDTSVMAQYFNSTDGLWGGITLHKGGGLTLSQPIFQAPRAQYDDVNRLWKIKYFQRTPISKEYILTDCSSQFLWTLEVYVTGVKPGTTGYNLYWEYTSECEGLVMWGGDPCLKKFFSL